MELDARLNLHLLQVVGIGKREGTTQVDTFTGSLKASFCHSTIADNIDVKVLGLDKLIGGFRHLSRDFTNRQLPA